MEKGKKPEKTAVTGDKNAKSRGRPPKESTDAATDLQRARVRRAQKAYRIRKEAHVGAIEQKVQDLEKVVDAMTSEFVGFSDALVRGGNLDEGVVGPLLRGTLERFLELGKKVAIDPDEDQTVDSDTLSNERGKEKEVPTNTLDESLDDWQLSSEVLLPTEEDFSLLLPGFIPPRERDLQNLRTPAPNPANFTAFNPYINNLWNIASASPLAASVVPYILAGRDSFASRLYFETISLAVRSLRGDAPYHFAQGMFRFKLRFVTRSQLFVILAGVLSMLLQGTNIVVDGYDELRAWEDERNVKRDIISQIERKGAREEEFLSTWEVERYLRERWRLGLDSRAVRTAAYGGQAGMLSGFAPTLVPGFEAREQVLNADPLVERLKPAAVTIGEGPRWHLSDIDAVVQGFFRREILCL